MLRVKVVLIGSTGHYYSFHRALDSGADIQYVGFANGFDGEDNSHYIRVFASKYGTKVYDNYMEMIKAEKPDIALVCSHYYRNAGISMDLLKAGVSVYSEKPVATTIEDLDLLEKTYEQSDAHFSAMLEMRYTPAFKAAHDAVKKGLIGDVIMVTAQKSYKLNQRPEFYKKRETFGGTIPWVGIHAIDWIRWISGKEIVSASALQSNKYNNNHGELETIALCQFGLEDGSIAAVNIDYMRPAAAKTHGDDRVRVVGSKGIIEVRDGKAWLLDDDKEMELELEEEQNPFIAYMEQVKGNGRCRVQAEDAFRSTRAALMARQAADEGRIISF